MQPRASSIQPWASVVQVGAFSFQACFICCILCPVYRTFMHSWLMPFSVSPCASFSLKHLLSSLGLLLYILGSSFIYPASSVMHPGASLVQIGVLSNHELLLSNPGPVQPGASFILYPPSSSLGFFLSSTLLLICAAWGILHLSSLCPARGFGFFCPSWHLLYSRAASVLNPLGSFFHKSPKNFLSITWSLHGPAWLFLTDIAVVFFP